VKISVHALTKYFRQRRATEIRRSGALPGEFGGELIVVSRFVGTEIVYYAVKAISVCATTVNEYCVVIAVLHYTKIVPAIVTTTVCHCTVTAVSATLGFGSVAEVLVWTEK
jgi:hypothetical protein